jgi:hypothetical protein
MASDSFGKLEGPKEQHLIMGRSDHVVIVESYSATIVPGNATTTGCLEGVKTTASIPKESSSSPCSALLASSTTRCTSELSATPNDGSRFTSPSSGPQVYAILAIVPLSSQQPEGNCFECGPVPTVIPATKQSVTCAANCSQEAAVALSNFHDIATSTSTSTHCEGCCNTADNSTTSTSCVASGTYNQTSTLHRVPIPTTRIDTMPSNAATSITHAEKWVLGLAFLTYMLWFP